jgi:hypothetical protein
MCIHATIKCLHAYMLDPSVDDTPKERVDTSGRGKPSGPGYNGN